MNILVTGGAGFIGSNVVDGLISGGNSVTVVDNLFTGKEENINPKAEFFKADIRDKGLLDIFEKVRPEVVNHHAAQMSVPASVKDPSFDADVNVLGLINVLECCRKTGVGKVVFISTGGAVYGDPEIYPTPEDCPIRPFSPYAVTKYIAEHYLNFYYKQHGLDYTVLRYANVFGPRQVPHAEAGVVSIFMEKFYRGELPTLYRFEDEPDGMIRDYCYVGDIVKANLLSLDKGSAGVFNIGSGRGTRTRELYRAVLACMRQRGYATDERFDTPSEGAARHGDLRRSCLVCDRAADVLGWTPGVTLPDGLDSTVEWFLKQKAGA